MKPLGTGAVHGLMRYPPEFPRSGSDAPICISGVALALGLAIASASADALTSQESAGSEHGFRTEAAMKASDWHGKWIGLDGVEQTNWLQEAYAGFLDSNTRLSWIWCPADESQKSAPTGTFYFRREIVIPDSKPAIKEVHLQYAGDAECRAWINGFDLGTKRGWSFVKDADVTGRVHAGTNVICLAGVNNDPNAKTAGVIAYIEYEFIKGDAFLYWTDEQWKVSDRAEKGWNQRGFDDSKWKVARTLAVVGAAPWGNIRAPEGRLLPARYLRKDFLIDKKVARAVVSFAGLGWSELYLNGAKVGDAVLSPDIGDYAKRVSYLSWDVTKQLREGTNTLGAILGNGTYYAPRSEVISGTASFGWPKMVLQLRIDYSDGTASDVVSDDTWQISVQGPIRANNIYDGEDYDASYDLTGWNKPGYGTVRNRAKTVRAPSVSHYNPSPVGGIVESKPFNPEWQPAHVVAAPAGELVEQGTEPVRIEQTLKPIALSEPNPGVFVLDMGRSVTGWCRLRVAGPAQTEVTLRHAAALKSDGTVDITDLQGAKATDTYTLRGSGGEEVWEPRFTFHKFRYVEVTGYPGKPTLGSIEGRLLTRAPGGL